MFELTYFAIFVILLSEQTLAIRRLQQGDASDAGWGLFLSVSQGREQLPRYDIGHWTRQLHLQQCAFVEIGEEFCALFVELRSIPSVGNIQDSSGVGEFFLGLCKCATVRSWILCSDQLMLRRKSDCIFTEGIPAANTSARVHRRLCDVTLLTEYAEPCNCSDAIANQQLYRTEGFPTCFLSPLPESLCSPRGVCGIARCCTTTVEGIHSPQCDPNCHGNQPFCEEVGPWTSIPPAITSLWSHWSTPVCKNSDGRVFSTATAICHDKVTGQPDIDCIGPGSFCCPVDDESCTCVVTNEGGVLKATRMVESTPCIVDFIRDQDRHFREIKPGHRKNHQAGYGDSNRLYQDAVEEGMEYQSNSEYEDLTSPWRRRLMYSSYDYFEDREQPFESGAELAEEGTEKAPVTDEIKSDKSEKEDKNDAGDKGDKEAKTDAGDKGIKEDKNDKGEKEEKSNVGDKGDKSDTADKEDSSDKGIKEDKSDTGDIGDTIDKSDTGNKLDTEDKDIMDDEDDDDDEEADDDEDDMGMDAEDQLAGEDEDEDLDSTESSEFYDYVRSVRDSNMKKKGIRMRYERPAKYVQTNPFMYAVVGKREDVPQPADDTDEECEEEDKVTPPLIYSDYDPEANGNEDDVEKSGDDDYDEEVSSLAVIGRSFRPSLVYQLSTCICIALCT